MRVQLLGILDTDDWEERGEEVSESIFLQGLIGLQMIINIAFNGFDSVGHSVTVSGRQPEFVKKKKTENLFLAKLYDFWN